jgi:phage shock protein PspC (stress-responsive transcriptional regulator)
MKKVVTINIAGRSFYIDEDAYARLNQYLKTLEKWSRNKEGGREMFSDIEGRIRELFEEKIEPSTGVISLELVNEIISTMGEPEDFTGESNEEDTRSKEQATNTTIPSSRKLYRDIEDRVLGGVCSGIAAYFNIDRVFVRVLFAILPFLSFGAIIPIYIILWIAIPPALTSTQRLEMRGHNVNISNIEKTIRDEYNEVKQRFQSSNTYRKGENYLGRFKKRDRTALIITSIVIGVIILANLVSIPFEMGFFPAFHFNMPMGHLGFPGIFPLVLILRIYCMAAWNAFIYGLSKAILRLTRIAHLRLKKHARPKT